MSSWYVIKVLPGKERQLTEQLNLEISLGKIKNITRFVCPTEKSMVTVRNKNVLREKVIYSGYLYFESSQKLSEDELKYISHQPSIMGMLHDRKPILLHESDVALILKDDSLENHLEGKKTKFTKGEEITLTTGPFSGFNGIISSIKNDSVDVEVLIFGRPTNVTVMLDQIKK